MFVSKSSLSFEMSVSVVSTSFASNIKSSTNAPIVIVLELNMQASGVEHFDWFSCRCFSAWFGCYFPPCFCTHSRLSTLCVSVVYIFIEPVKFCSYPYPSVMFVMTSVVCLRLGNLPVHFGGVNERLIAADCDPIIFFVMESKCVMTISKVYEYHHSSSLVEFVPLSAWLAENFKIREARSARAECFEWSCISWSWDSPIRDACCHLNNLWPQVCRYFGCIQKCTNLV